MVDCPFILDSHLSRHPIFLPVFWAELSLEELAELEKAVREAGVGIKTGASARLTCRLSTLGAFCVRVYRTMCLARCSVKPGFDTSLLMIAEVTGHPEHEATRVRLTELRDTGSRFAMAPQVLAEFVHVVTTPSDSANHWK